MRLRHSAVAAGRNKECATHHTFGWIVLKLNGWLDDQCGRFDRLQPMDVRAGAGRVSSRPGQSARAGRLECKVQLPNAFWCWAAALVGLPARPRQGQDPGGSWRRGTRQVRQLRIGARAQCGFFTARTGPGVSPSHSCQNAAGSIRRAGADAGYSSCRVSFSWPGPRAPGRTSRMVPAKDSSSIRALPFPIVKSNRLP